MKVAELIRWGGERGELIASRVDPICIGLCHRMRHSGS